MGPHRRFVAAAAAAAASAAGVACAGILLPVAALAKGEAELGTDLASAPVLADGEHQHRRARTWPRT